MSPLTVAVDPSNPNRINLTGDNFAFTATSTNGRVNLTGVNKVVTAEFVDPQADISWGGGNSISSSSWMRTTNQWYQHHMPDEVDHSMKSTTNLTGIYLGTNTSIDWRGISWTENYQHSCQVAGGTEGAVYRRNLTTFATNGKALPDGVIDLQMIAYTDDIVYVFGRTTDAFVIYKVEWGSPSTVTLMEQQTGPWNYYGVDLTPFDTYCCARLRNAGNDVMLCTASITGPGAEEALAVMVYNLSTDSLINFEIVTSSYSYVTSLGGEEVATIAQSGNTAAFVTEAMFDEDLIENGDPFCRCPIITVNINSGSVTLTELPLNIFDNDDQQEEFYYAGLGNAVQDPTNGDLYYHTQRNDPVTSIENYYIRKASGPGFTPETGWDYGETMIYRLEYGDGGTVTHRAYDGSSNWVLIKRPAGTTLCTLDADQKDNWGAIDDENEMYWTVYLDYDKLVGKSFGAGPDRNITIDGYDTGPTGGIIGRQLFMYNGYAVVSGYDGAVSHYWFMHPTIGSESPSISPSPSIGSASISPSPSTGSGSASASASASPSVSPSRSASPSISPSPSASRSASPSVSASPSLSPSGSISPSASGSPSLSPSGSISQSASVSPSPSESASASPSPEASQKRTTNIGANVEYKDDTNYLRVTNIGAEVEYKDDTNYMRITAIGIMVEYHDVPSPSISPSPSASPSSSASPST